MIKLGIRILPHFKGLPLPAYQSAQAAGMDIAAAVWDTVLLPPGGRALIPSGMVIELPAGYEAQIRPRSGLALKHGVTVLNTPGTIDADYRGEIGVLLINLGSEPFAVERGMRVAQLVLSRIERAECEPRLELSESERGGCGFGSSGL